MTTPPLLLSAIIPAHNPHRGRLRRTLAALRAQVLPAGRWETVLVDNASVPPIDRAALGDDLPSNLRLVREPDLGLTRARLRGVAESRADLLVFVDDDNLLAPDYLANVVRHFAADSGLGALGGRVNPEFEQPPAAWVAQFHSLLALRDHGAAPLRARWSGTEPRDYPSFAPVGAGLAVRRTLACEYATALALDPRRRTLDRTGDQLVSGGDNDLVMHVLESGGSVGYEPDLVLTHLIPAGRTERAYLGSLNRAVARSWVRVLALHGLRPWRPVAPVTVGLRQGRAWWRGRAWRDAAAWVNWQGLCGTFEGQADLTRMDSRDRGRSRARS